MRVMSTNNKKLYSLGGRQVNIRPTSVPESCSSNISTNGHDMWPHDEDMNWTLQSSLRCVTSYTHVALATTAWEAMTSDRRHHMRGRKLLVGHR